MSLSYVTREEAAKRLAHNQSVSQDSIEALCDLVRAEVHARQHAPRAVTLSRVARLLVPAISVDEQHLEDACDALEREGDVILNPGGILYATPTRVVALEDRARIFSSLPTRALSKGLEQDVVAQGASRMIRSLNGLAEAVDNLSGVMLSPEAWAGFERSPVADAAFLEKLDQRLEWQELGAGSLEKDGELEWRVWRVAPEGARWRRSDEGQLWWARTRFGGHHRVWTKGASPATSGFITLSHDEADRARFALSRQLESASLLSVERSGKYVTLKLPGWLPRPEYRWLSLHAAPVAESKGMSWEISAGAEALVSKVLTERLGLVAEVR